jgi:CRP-like cAMP-binding protein
MPLFKSLDEDQRKELARSLQRREFAAGVTLFHQDMPGMMLYLIDKGHVKIFSLGRTGQELTFEIFGQHDIFGELSILDNKHHSASAITLSHSVIWLLPKTAIDKLLDSNTSVAKAFIRILVNRIRARALYTEAMTFQDVQGRLAFSLVQLAERFGTPTENGIKIDLPLTQVDLGAIIGVTRESINKALTTLRTANLVQVEGTSIIIQNNHGLIRMIQDRGR